MAKKKITAKKKFKRVEKEFKEKKLHSGSKKGPLVTNPKQMVAIAYSEQAKADESKGMKKAMKKKKSSERGEEKAENKFKKHIAEHLKEDVREAKKGIKKDKKDIKKIKKDK